MEGSGIDDHLPLWHHWDLWWWFYMQHGVAVVLDETGQCINTNLLDADWRKRGI